jgi:hypothetical protein
MAELLKDLCYVSCHLTSYFIGDIINDYVVLKFESLLQHQMVYIWWHAFCLDMTDYSYN